MSQAEIHNSAHCYFIEVHKGLETIPHFHPTHVMENGHDVARLAHLYIGKEQRIAGVACTFAL
jgi:hypothetical protein